MIGRLIHSGWQNGMGWLAGQSTNLAVQTSDLRSNQVFRDWKGVELVLLKPEQLHFLPPGTMLSTIDGKDAFVCEHKEIGAFETRGGYLPLGLSVDSPLVRKGYLQRVVDDDSELEAGYVSDVRQIENELYRSSLGNKISDSWNRFLDRISWFLD